MRPNRGLGARLAARTGWQATADTVLTGANTCLAARVPLLWTLPGQAFRPGPDAVNAPRDGHSPLFSGQAAARRVVGDVAEWSKALPC